MLGERLSAWVAPMGAREGLDVMEWRTPETPYGRRAHVCFKVRRGVWRPACGADSSQWFFWLTPPQSKKATRCTRCRGIVTRLYWEAIERDRNACITELEAALAELLTTMTPTGHTPEGSN